MPKLTDGSALPAPARFGAWFESINSQREVATNISGDRSARTMEVKSPSQFVSQEREIQRLGMRQNLREKLVGLRRPIGAVVATRAVRRKPGFVAQPLVAELIKPAATDEQSVHGRLGIDLTRVESLQDFLDQERVGSVSELAFFMHLV